MDIILLLLLCFGIFVIGLSIYATYFRYRRNVDRLNACMASRTVKPAKGRFVLAWFVYGLEVLIPAIPIIWLISRDGVYTMTWTIFMSILFLSLGVSAYPYYTIAVLEDGINGPTRWGWFWKRIDIRFDEIDRERTLGQQFGRKLGMMVIHSRRGERILTLGLDEQQLEELVERGRTQGSAFSDR